MDWVIITMAMVDVDGSSKFSADSQPKLIGLVWVLVATQCSVYIHQMNWVNSRNDFGHDQGCSRGYTPYAYLPWFLSAYTHLSYRKTRFAWVYTLKWK